MFSTDRILELGLHPNAAVVLSAAGATGNERDGIDSDAGADYPLTHPAGSSGGSRVVQRRGRPANGLMSLAVAAVLVAACGGGGSGGETEPRAAPGPPPDGEQSGFELNTENATSAAASALALVANAHGEAEYAVFVTNALAVAISQGTGVALSCGPDDPGRPPTVHWQDADADGRLSPGDAVVASGGTCGDQTDAHAELDVTAYASDELGVVELRGELEFSMSVAAAGQPATSTEGSLTLDYAAPEGRIDALLSGIELATRTGGAAVSLSGGLHALKFDHAKQTRTVSFSGEVENDASGETFRFDTPVAFEHDWRTHPSLGELVVRTGRSTAKVATLPGTRRRAWASLAVDRDASGDYETQTELRWDDLAGGESQLLFEGFFGFAGALRGFFLLPFGPETHKALDAYAAIPRDNLPESGTVRYEWYRNGQRVLVSYPDYYLPARETTKGDFIEAKLLFSSAPDATRTAAATVRNSPPGLHVVLSPEGADTADDIVATVDYGDEDGDAVELRHEWLVNEVVVEDVSGDTLPAGRHERGDRVTHTLFADDGEDVSEFATTITVADAEPRLLGEAPSTVAQGQEATFEVVVEDPDGDPVDPGQLRVDYGPPGMSIDGETGRATFVPTMPLFDRAMDFHWQIGSSEASVAPLTGTVTVVDEEGGYPLFRTRLQKPVRMSVDDLDGDGDEEALVLGKAGPHVLEWNGEEYVQSWAYPLAYGTEAYLAMAHADIDGDGRHEIFVATESWSEAAKIIRLGGEERRLAAAAPIPRVDNHHALECRDIDAGDLDGDGVWELACLTSMQHVVVFAADDLTVLWISEQAEAPLGDGVFGWGLAVGNVDDDTSLEIVTSTGHVYDGTSRTLEWSHDGVFSTRSVSLGDLDGDGIQEIIGNGVFRFGDGPLDHPAPSSSGYERTKGAVADTNGDGRGELVWWDSGDDLVLAVYQYGELVGEPELLYEIPLLAQVSPGFTEELPHEQWYERLVAHIAAGDLDGDGHEELVLAGPTYHAVVGFDGGQPEFEWLVADVRSAEFRGGVFESGQPPGLLFIARSGEPRSDEIWCPTCRQAVMRLPLHPRATPTLAPTTTQPSGHAAISRFGTVTDMVAADVNGDGMVEVTVALLGPQDTGADAGRDVTSLHTFDTNANEWTAIEQLADLGHAGRSRNAFAPWRLALGDVNGDGRADLLAGGAFPEHSREPHIVVFDLFGDEVLFETDFELAYDGEYAVAAIAGADLNGDGRAEIVVAAERESHSRDRLFTYSRQGESMEFKRTDYDVGLRKIYDIAVSDFDGDGQPELALLGEPTGYGSLAVARLNSEFEELNQFVIDERAHTTRRLLVPEAGRVGLGRRTVLFMESEGESWNTASTVVAGFDVMTGNRIWESPKLLGLFRDIAYVHDGERPRWVIASSYGMHVTR